MERPWRSWKAGPPASTRTSGRRRPPNGSLVTVAGPWWALRPDSPVYRDARLAAARDAMVRAREYAEAFGGGVAGLIEAADAGLLTSAGEQGPHFRATAAGGAASFALRAAQAELDFEPARQTVTAQVEARFAMTVPDS